jgi:hypothetical protein
MGNEKCVTKLQRVKKQSARGKGFKAGRFQFFDRNQKLLAHSRKYFHCLLDLFLFNLLLTQISNTLNVLSDSFWNLLYGQCAHLSHLR